MVPKRVATPGDVATTHRSPVLIRLPNLDKATNQPPLAERIGSFAERIDWRGKLPAFDWRRALGQLGPGTLELLLRHPRVVAGTTLLALVQLTALVVMRDSPAPSVAGDVSVPTVELSTTPGVLAPAAGAPEAHAWNGAPTVEIGAVNAVPVDTSMPTFVAPAMPAPPPGFGGAPAERMARLPQASMAPTGYEPRPAPSGVAELGGQITPVGVGSQR